MSELNNYKENINNIYEILEKKQSIKRNDSFENINIFNISFNDGDKNDIYLKDFISNDNFFEEEKEDHCENKLDKKEKINTISEQFTKKKETNKEFTKNNKKFIKEILDILRKPLSIKNSSFYESPFKPLFKPKKISMDGKIILNNLLE